MKEWEDDNMKIIEPKVELFKEEIPVTHIAKCARICYGNAVSKGETNDRGLCERLLKSGHLSVFRHESVYAIISKKILGDLQKDELTQLGAWCPYVQVWIDDPFAFYVATNGNFILDNAEFSVCDIIKENRVSSEWFESTEIGHKLMRYTFHITTQISTSRELNRVSPNDITEKSTRYVHEDGIICRPHWMDSSTAADMNLGDYLDLDNKFTCFYDAWKSAFSEYHQLIDLGVKREDARGVLPLDTATEVVYTYSVDEWKHIIELRSDKKAHPNAQIIANMIKSKLEELGYDFKQNVEGSN